MQDYAKIFCIVLLVLSITKKLGYTEIAVMPCVFNGIPDEGLVMLEKKLG